MKVVFDSRPAGDPRGIGRYTRCILTALRATAGAHELAESHRPRDGDVFHSPWLDGVKIRCAVPQVVTLHDLVPLKRGAEYLRTGVRFRLRYAAVSRAARIIVPTESVAVDVIERLGVERERIAVVAEAAAPAFGPRPPAEVEAVRERYGVPADYLLWVGGLRTPDPRKRVAQLVATPRTLPLVLAGPASRWAHELASPPAHVPKNGEGVRPLTRNGEGVRPLTKNGEGVRPLTRNGEGVRPLTRSGEGSGPAPGLVVTGEVTDDELAALYTGARALVFPSDEEGFGLPPVEALACGTPVVACDVPGVRDVLKGRATLVDPDDLDGLVAAAEAAERPAPEPPAWTWEDAARATWQVYADARSSF